MKAKKRIFLDANVLLDVLLEREPFYHDALKIWAAYENGLVEGYVSAITINNVYYIVRRLKSESTAMVCVRILLRIFKVVAVDTEVLSLSADLHNHDYEDDIQLQCAMRSRCSQLFTRDATHFDNTQIAVVPPSSFTLT